jgi:type VI protein secretion system component VasF
MTDPSDRPHASQDEVPSQAPSGEPLTVPVETQMAVQQLREAGFSEDQQAALTTALLRVLALWTQQATRGDLHAEHQALAQRLAQQLDAWHEDMRREIGHHADAVREDMRREVAQHADTLREELRGAFAQQADLFRTTRPEPPRWRDVPLWLTTALLVLTAVGVLLLVVYRFVSP